MYKSTVDIKETLMTAAMKAVRIYGMDGLRVQHIADIAGVVDSNINRAFGGKDALLWACFERVDRQIARIFNRARIDPERLSANPKEELRRLWPQYWQWLIEHPDETVFYSRFRAGIQYTKGDKTRDTSHFDAFDKGLQKICAREDGCGQTALELLWLQLLSVPLLYAGYVAEGILPNTSDMMERVFRLEIAGLTGIIEGEG